MKSFGIWYKKVEFENNENSGQTEDQGQMENSSSASASNGDTNQQKKEERIEPKAAVHVNFWSYEDIIEPKNQRKPFLDIGIKIENYKLIDELCFHCPFPLKKENIRDLSRKMEKKSNACLIFNEDCEVETKDSYIIVKIGENEEKEEILLFSLDQVVKNVYEVQPAEGCEEATNIIFKLKDFIAYISNIKNFNSINKIYIRFRIVDVQMMNYLFFDSEPLNKSFESAFSGTRILDFKINEKRNINEKEKAAIVIGKKAWLPLTKVHFLVMIPSSFDLEALSAYRTSCRELEDQVWDDYLEMDEEPKKSVKRKNKKKDHMLAYHWKTDKDDDSQAFSCLVKIKYHKARANTILSYCSWGVALGLFGDLIMLWISGFKDILRPMYTIGAVLFFIVLALGLSRKK